MTCRLIGDRVYAYYLYLGYYIYKYRDEIRVSQKWTAFLCFAGMAVSFGVTYGVTVLEQDHYEGALTYAMPSVILSGAAFFLYVLRVKGRTFPAKRKSPPGHRPLWRTLLWDLSDPHPVSG